MERNPQPKMGQEWGPRLSLTGVSTPLLPCVLQVSDHSFVFVGNDQSITHYANNWLYKGRGVCMCVMLAG